MLIQDDRRTHGRLRSFSRLQPISRRWRQWKQEINHLIIEQNSSPRADTLWPETTPSTIISVGKCTGKFYSSPGTLDTACWLRSTIPKVHYPQRLPSPTLTLSLTLTLTLTLTLSSGIVDLGDSGRYPLCQSILGQNRHIGLCYMSLRLTAWVDGVLMPSKEVYQPVMCLSCSLLLEVTILGGSVV